MFEVTIKRRIGNQIIKPIVTSETYNKKLAADNIKAHLINIAAQGSPVYDEINGAGLIIKDRPIMRAIYRLLRLNADNLNVKVRGHLLGESKGRQLRVILHEETIKFKELKDVVRNKEFPSRNSFVARLDMAMDCVVYKEPPKALLIKVEE